ncbi:MAG: ribosome maturation factor RimM [Candidatus Nanopelagicales bacterium]|nr:ribosome maturation factor RimM [Candidatus Nanopelagicales bacterium]
MRVVVGRIGRPHGVRGQVTVEPRTDEPDLRFAPGAAFVIPGRARPLVVEHVHWHSGRLLLSFEGVHDRTAAESLRNMLLEIDRAPDEMPDDPDEYYDDQLEGCRVELVDGSQLGIVDEVIHLPSQDMLSVLRADGTEVLIPFLAQFVPTVDITAGRIVVDPPHGLIEDLDA